VLRRISGLKRKYQEAGGNCIMNSVICNATKYFSVDEVEDFALYKREKHAVFPLKI